jgi:single-stranded-DNA-specific exonuclease
MNTTFAVEKLHPLTRLLLEKRGLKESEEIEDFLFPSYEKHIGDPFGIHGMEKAVNRIIEAIKKGEKIAVYSDYDCDGVPGGVLLRTFFDDTGYPVEMYIPHRHNEGYGINTKALDSLLEKGVSLVITVDLAITNIEEIAYAKEIGIDVIVTDHHLPVTKEEDGNITQVIPDAVAVLNSKQDVCTYSDDMLCGCAVAWKLSCAVLSFLREDVALYKGIDGNVSSSAEIKESYYKVLVAVSGMGQGYEKWLLDLVGISTIADMVPLVKENRALAHFGLKVLRKTKRHGLLHIFNEQRMKKEFLTEEDIAFTIAPRINAASRMGDPIQAHMMLYEKDRESAEGYAFDLEELNTQRKGEVKDIVSTISFDQEVYKNNVIVVGDSSWGPGILGLIAQKIIDETGKPVFVWGQGDDKNQAKGSCRSRGDVHVIDLMAHVGHEVLGHWGGHEQAGGFSLHLSDVDKLSGVLNESYNHVEKKEIGSQEVVSDTSLSIDDINDVVYEAVAILAPFGVGNPKPIFEIKNPHVLATKWFGKKGEHFEVVYATSKGGKVKAIQFFASKEIEGKVTGPHLALVHIEKSYFGGKVELRMRLVEVR